MPATVDAISATSDQAATYAREAERVSETGRAAKATVDIRSRIGTLRQEMVQIVDVMQSGSERVEEGRSSIETAGTEMEQLSDRMAEVPRGMTEVAEILGEQRAATREISEGIGVTRG